MVNAINKEKRLADVEIKDSDVCDVCATAKQVLKTFKVNDEDSKVRESARSDAVVCLDNFWTYYAGFEVGIQVHRDLHNDEESKCNTLPTAKEE